MNRIDVLRLAANRRRVADDPQLAELLDAYRHAVPGRVPPCTVEFEDLALRRRRPVGRWLAAAVLLIGVGLGFAFLSSPDRAPAPPVVPPTLRLAAIPLSAAEPVEPAWPATLASYEPANTDGLRWYDDLDEARELAAFLDRPILVFMEYRQDGMECPICASYARGPFRESEVMREGSKFVLVRLNFVTTPPPLGRTAVRTWPLFHVLDTQGDKLLSFGGPTNGRGLAELFSRADKAARKKTTFSSRDWRQARTLAQLAQRRNWSAVFEADKDGPFGAVARDRLEDEARAALLSRDGERVKETAERMADTPYAADLFRVLRHIKRYGAFPELE
ncbi:MAG: hypothetical protein ACYTGZ_02750 [Planctomycetota bacterium]|jgi:hypothetical protein